MSIGLKWGPPMDVSRNDHISPQESNLSHNECRGCTKPADATRSVALVQRQLSAATPETDSSTGLGYFWGTPTVGSSTLTGGDTDGAVDGTELVIRPM